ncbi:MAG: GTP pyrophosphokinase family protein [Lachnospiraceae bacterium]|nr:GTP pyrophosphokinase family protein [Lachnospiraceae bacterium]
MEIKVEDEGARSYEEVMLIYDAALRQMETKLSILSEEFQLIHRYNPIEHTKARRKTSPSIVKKLKRHGYEATLANMVKYCDDIAGVRVICSYTSDVYRIADMISNQDDIRVLAIKDYIEKPKSSGYESYHMLVMIPVYLSDRIIDTKVEIQIRTIAMDFWASLEHKIQYKFEGEVPESITQELLDCAKMVSALDAKMLQLNNEIQELGNKEQY